ncbi:MAG: hypothetical protein JWQ43_1031, partial [Glaciihabitans sp.]|nr:hypothetical protein [Glaciihabitans sp.]
LSVQWGRGKWLPWRWLRPAVIVVSVASVLVLPGLVTAAAASTGTADDYAEAPATEVGYVEGLQLDGEPVSNIFAYDAAGNALSDVQLFDQNGNEIITVNYADMGGVRELYDNNSGQLYYLVPNAGVTNGVGWNVFPLRTADKEDLTFSNSSNILSTGEAAVTSPAIPPFRTVQPLIEQPEPGTTPTATPTGEPTNAPDPAAVTDPAAPGTMEPGTTAPDTTEPGSPEPDPASPEPSVAPEATPSQ